MAHVGARLNVDEEITRRLGSEEAPLWRAAHGDGSENRMNIEAVLDAATYDASLGILSAAFQGIRKAWRNRGKTREDLAAEKEAARINMSCVSLGQMLLEYVEAAREGRIDPEALGELTDALKEVEGYRKAGKLKVTGDTELRRIREAVWDFTDAIGKDMGVQAGPRAQEAEEDFGLIREALTRQREWIS